jgi:hypothetical protein
VFFHSAPALQPVPLGFTIHRICWRRPPWKPSHLSIP